MHSHTNTLVQCVVEWMWKYSFVFRFFLSSTLSIIMCVVYWTVHSILFPSLICFIKRFSYSVHVENVPMQIYKQLNGEDKKFTKRTTNSNNNNGLKTRKKQRYDLFNVWPIGCVSVLHCHTVHKITMFWSVNSFYVFGFFLLFEASSRERKRKRRRRRRRKKKLLAERKVKDFNILIMFSKQTIENWYPFALGGNKYLTNGFVVPLASFVVHDFHFSLFHLSWSVALLLFRTVYRLLFLNSYKCVCQTEFSMCYFGYCNFFHVLNALFSLTLVKTTLLHTHTHRHTVTPNSKTIDKNAFGNGNTHSCA